MLLRSVSASSASLGVEMIEMIARLRAALRAASLGVEMIAHLDVRTALKVLPNEARMQHVMSL